MVDAYFFLPRTRRVLLGLLLLAAAPAALAQTPGVGIGTTAPDASAALDVTSSSKGVLVPRMTELQRNAITSPAAGLQIYNTTFNKLNVWNGTAWTQVLSDKEVPNTTTVNQTFTYTGGVQTYTVPANIYSLTVTVNGAQGGAAAGNVYAGGLGGRAVGTIAVTPGEVLSIYVGGQGSIGTSGATVAGGYNGGGTGAAGGGGGGGGASDVRQGGTALVNRVVTGAGGGGAGAGGGGSGGASTAAGNGGSGGGTIGGTGGRGGYAVTDPGTGGTGSTGGSLGGALGQGGNAFAGTTGGGGGGGCQTNTRAGGGGGSSFASGGTYATGVNSGNGSITITGSNTVTAAPVLDATNFINLPFTASNGLTKTGSDIALGGTLTGVTSIANGGFNLNVTGTGNVGIGTASPANPLDVVGNASVSGNVGIGTTAPLNKLDIQSANARTGTHGSGLPLYVTGAMSDAASGIEFRHYNGTQGLGFGFNSIYAAGTNAIQNVNIMPKGGGNVGIGTITPVTQLANTSSNIVGTDGAGTGAQALSWLHASSGYAGAFFNAHSSIANADGLAVKIANPGAVALDISQGAAAGTAGTSLLRVNGSGNVGIGTNAPGARLSVLGTGGATTDLTVNGRISTGDAGGLGGVYVNQSGTQFVGQYNATTLGLFNAGWHLQVSNTGNVRLPGGGGGDTWFNNADGKTYLRGTTILADAGGFVGIGTTSPVAKLHVSGFRVGTMCADGTTYFSQANGAFLSYTSSGSGGGPKSLSGYFDGGELWVNNSIVAGNLCVSSDARIKHNLGLSDRAADLARLLQLRITNYRYIDQVNNTHDVVKKVIAQEVRAIYPEATNKGTAAIPNVYERATRVAFANGRLTVTTAKPHDLPAAGGRMRLYTKENQDLHVDCRVEDAHTFSFASSENYAELFVYGKYVDDFLSVDYDALAMLNISATQELARQVAALQQENAALKTRAAQADTDHASLLTLQAQMARLLGADGQARK